MEIEGNQVATELPKGQQIESISFEKVVAESKSELKAQAEAQVKRSRGRPPGSGKHQKAAAAAGPSVNSEPPPIAQPQPQASLLQADTVNDLKPLLKDALKTPFSIVAQKYQNDKIELTEAEAETPSIYLSKYLTFVFPELEAKGPKEFNLYAFLISTILVILKKVPYLKNRIRQTENQPDTRTQHSEPLNENPAPIPNQSEQVQPVAQPGIGAGSFFRPRQI